MPNIRLVTFAGETVTPLDDALIYQTAVSDSGIIYGASVTLADSNTLHIAAGYGLASGRFFEVYDADIIIPLASSGTLNGQLYVHMDLGSALSPIDILYETASSLTPMQQDANVNITNGIYEFQLATFKISTTTISGLAYTAPIVSGAGAGLIGQAENSNKASKSYAVGDLMIWTNKLWKVRTAIARNATITTSKLIATNVITEIGTINTNLGGFSFGYTSDNKPGFLAPGADAVVPFSGITVFDTLTNVRLNINQTVTLAENVNLGDYRFFALYIVTQDQHPYCVCTINIANVMSVQMGFNRPFTGQDPRAYECQYGIFIPIESTATGSIVFQCYNAGDGYSFSGKSVTLYGIR